MSYDLLMPISRLVLNRKRRRLGYSERTRDYIDHDDLEKIIDDLMKDFKVGDKVTAQIIVNKLGLILTKDGSKSVSRKISKFVSHD